MATGSPSSSARLARWRPELTLGNDGQRVGDHQVRMPGARGAVRRALGPYGLSAATARRSFLKTWLEVDRLGHAAQDGAAEEACSHAPLDRR